MGTTFPGGITHCEALRFATSLRIARMPVSDQTERIAKLYASQLH